MQKLQSGSRPPRGGRGLKYVDVVYRMVNVESPPSRGAWIEISLRTGSYPSIGVAPLAGGVD